MNGLALGLGVEEGVVARLAGRTLALVPHHLREFSHLFYLHLGEVLQPDNLDGRYCTTSRWTDRRVPGICSGSLHYCQTGLTPTSLSGMSGRVAFLLSAAAMLLFPAILNRPITVFLMEAPGGPVISAGDHGRQPVCEVGEAPCRRGRNELLSHGEFLVFGDSKKGELPR